MHCLSLSLSFLTKSYLTLNHDAYQQPCLSSFSKPTPPFPLHIYCCSDMTSPFLFLSSFLTLSKHLLMKDGSLKFLTPCYLQTVCCSTNPASDHAPLGRTQRPLIHHHSDGCKQKAIVEPKWQPPCLDRPP